MLVWLLAILAVGLALAAFSMARRLRRRLDQLTELYWELRYEQTQLRARVSRLDPDVAAGESAAAPHAPGAPVAFVPLSSVKR